jgi:hypothetical protein
LRLAGRHQLTQGAVGDRSRLADNCTTRPSWRSASLSFLDRPLTRRSASLLGQVSCWVVVDWLAGIGETCVNGEKSDGCKFAELRQQERRDRTPKLDRPLSVGVFRSHDRGARPSDGGRQRLAPSSVCACTRDRTYCATTGLAFHAICLSGQAHRDGAARGRGQHATGRPGAFLPRVRRAGALTIAVCSRRPGPSAKLYRHDIRGLIHGPANDVRRQAPRGSPVGLQTPSSHQYDPCARHGL